MATEVITQINNNSTKKERIFAAIKAGGIGAEGIPIINISNIT